MHTLPQGLPRCVQHALSADGLARLAAALGEAPVLAFDFDGTLSPVIKNPAAAMMPLGTAQRLFRLALRHPTVIVSGRPRPDVARRLHGIPIAEVVGNHGSEPWLDPAPLQAEVRGWLARLGARLPVPGVQLEDQGCTLSVHYRHVSPRQRTLAQTAIQAAAAELAVGRVIHGKLVANLLPAGALDKGLGLARAVAALGRTRAIYIGDDETDEDAFRRAPDVLGIRIGRRVGSAAALYLTGQCQLDDLLEALLRLSC